MSRLTPRRLVSLSVAACAALGLALAAPAGALADRADEGITISPASGTSASPQTQISILGTRPSTIRSVRVTGAVSGVHPGTLRSYSRARGASFVPATALTPGEKVTARILIKGCSPITRSFTIATAGITPAVLNINVIKSDLLEKFVTRPDLIAPKIAVHKQSSQASTGNIFLTPLPSPVVHPGSTTTVTISPVGPGGPMIIDKNGKLVWFKRLTPPTVAANLRLQQYNGKPVLTWWEGPVTAAAFGLGKGIIADSRYREIKTVNAGNGYPMDIHEFTLTPQGTALFTIYSPILVHLPGTAPGTTSPLLDAIVQEVDIETGLVTWEWHAYGHIPLADSYATPENSASYDAYHFNSVQSTGGGKRVFISARDTSALYEVDKATGKRLWTLGGKSGDFKLGKGARFWFQHHATLLPHGQVSVFDDEAGPPQYAPASRGLILGLDAKRRTAKVVRQYHRAADTSAQSEGSTQILKGGNVFVGFGSTEFFSEFSPSGKLLFDASLPNGDGSYRVYRHPWSTTPATLPDVAARTTDATHVAVYASWNGATTVARWEVLAGADAASLAPAGSAARTGFETQVDVAPSAVYAVRALDAKGKVLATSKTVVAQ